MLQRRKRKQKQTEECPKKKKSQQKQENKKKQNSEKRALNSPVTAKEAHNYPCHHARLNSLLEANGLMKEEVYPDGECFFMSTLKHIYSDGSYNIKSSKEL